MVYVLVSSYHFTIEVQQYISTIARKMGVAENTAQDGMLVVWRSWDGSTYHRKHQKVNEKTALIRKIT